jgi:hypothetical protein
MVTMLIPCRRYRATTADRVTKLRASQIYCPSVALASAKCSRSRSWVPTSNRQALPPVPVPPAQHPPSDNIGFAAARPRLSIRADDDASCLPPSSKIIGDPATLVIGFASVSRVAGALDLIRLSEMHGGCGVVEQTGYCSMSDCRVEVSEMLRCPADSEGIPTANEG